MLIMSPSMLKEPPVAQTRRGAATATAALE